LAFLLAEHIAEHVKVKKDSTVQNTTVAALNQKSLNKPDDKDFSEILKSSLIGKGTNKVELSIAELIKEISSLLSEMAKKHIKIEGKNSSNGIKTDSAAKKLLALVKNSSLLNDKDKKLILKKLLEKIKRGNIASLMAFIKEESAFLKKLAAKKNSASKGKIGKLDGTAGKTKNIILLRGDGAKRESGKTDSLKKLKVTDLRNRKAKNSHNKNSTFHTKTKATSNSQQTDTFRSVVSLHESNGNGTGLGLKDSTSNVSEFRNVLDRIRDLLQPDSVKKSGIILKENGNGEIHLVLRPESLGNVKIRLNITDNRIAGRIIVENNSMKQLIDSHLADLKTALMHDGFMGSSFDVSVSNGSAGKRNYQDLNGYGQFTDAGMAVEEFNSSAAILPQYGMEDLVVNLVV